MQRACGTCSTCQNPRLKKGCIKLKAMREADRASRHAAPKRQRQSVDAIPLAKLAQQPATITASPSSQQPSALSAPLVRGRSPSVDLNTTGHRDHNWPEINKRAGTEDSENQACQKKKPPEPDNNTEPVMLSSLGVASRDTPEDSFDSEVHAADETAGCNQHVHVDTNQATTSPAKDVPVQLAEAIAGAKDLTRHLTDLKAQACSDANKLADMVAQVAAERKAIRADAGAAQAGDSRRKAAEEQLHTALQTQTVLKELQKQLHAATGCMRQQADADAASQHEHLRQQQESTDRATAQAAAMSQQLQRDIKASQEAAAQAKAACHDLAAQKQELLAVQQQLAEASQRAQQMSSNLEVDAGSAQERFESQTKTFQTAKRDAATGCSRLQAIMAAAKQQHQQHMADIESHLQEATEATQHAQASEAEVKLTADSLRAAAKADQATATAAAQWTEAALLRLKDTLAAAAQDRAATTQQHAEKLRGFIQSTVHSAVCEATAGYRDVSELARDARGMLEGVCVELRATVHNASQTLDRRLRGVESAIASGSQRDRASAGFGQLGHHQVAQRASPENLQQLPAPSRPSSRASAQPAAPQRPGSALPQSMHTGQSMLNLLACQESLPTSTAPVPADAPVGSAVDQGKFSSQSAPMRETPLHLQQPRLLADFHQPHSKC